MGEEIDLFEFVHKTYIRPELERRNAQGKLPDSFHVHGCLILMPGNRPPIIYFNEEIGWSVKPKLAPGIEMTEGQGIYLHEIVDIEEVLPPTIDGKRVSFIYVFWNGLSYSLIVDPYHPDFLDRSFDSGQYIADFLRNHFREQAVKNARYVGQQLRSIGLWPAPSLLSYPISKIVERVGAGYSEQARQLLVDYCDIRFLREPIVNTWVPIAAFRERTAFFDDALFNHENKRYHGSISILVGQIEGVITDWLFDISYYTADKKRSLQEKIADFGNALDKIPSLLWLYRESRTALLDFLRGDPWLQRFQMWNQPIDTSFPGRHVVQHGKYDKEVFSEENSVKLFLMLDTICQFMMFYEAQVLGRNLGANN
jgi:hypothetical protein